MLHFLISFALLCSGSTLSDAQILLPASRADSTVVPKIDVPRQLTLDKAAEILVQNNLAITAARYGVDVARAQRLIASLKPNPAETVGAEQFDFTGSEVSCAFCDLVTTNSNSAANRTYTLRYDQVFERGEQAQAANSREVRCNA